MSLLQSIYQGIRGGLHAAGDPTDERYWAGSSASWASALAATGIRVNSDTAWQVSCIFQGTRVISETLGSLPRKLYRELANGGKELAKDDPRWPLIRRRPNAWQTVNQWVEMMTAQSILWGVGYSEIVPGPRGFADQLWPLAPGTVTTEQLSSGRLRFIVRDPGKAPRTLLQEQIFRLDGLCIRGILPPALLQVARDAIGLWLAMEKFNANFFAQGARPGLVIQKIPGTLSPKAREEAREAFAQNYGGVGNMHKALLLDRGAEAKEFGFSARDAQMTEARDAQVMEFCRFFNLSETRLRTGAGPKYGKIEEEKQEFVDFTIRPWAERFEACFERDLLDEDEDDLCLEHNFEGLLRGNTTDRFNAYSIAIMNGFMSENEVRARENLSPYPGLDEPRRSVNQDRGADPRLGSGGDTPPSDEPPAPPPSDAGDGEDAIAPPAPAIASPPRRLRLIAEEAARRVVRKETAELVAKAQKFAGNAPGWREAVETFYAAHTARVAETLQLEPAIARGYCERHRDALLAGGAIVLQEWEVAAVQELTDLALEETDHVHSSAA